MVHSVLNHVIDKLDECAGSLDTNFFSHITDLGILDRHTDSLPKK